MRWDGDWAGEGVVAPLFTAGDRVALTGKNGQILHFGAFW